MKKLAIISVLLIALVIGALGGFYISMPPSRLVVSCTSDASPLPASWACAYVRVFGGLDPNEQIDGDANISIFAFTMNGYGLESDAYGFSDERTLALLKFFIDEGVDFEAPHDNSLTPLHAAVLMKLEPVLELLVENGAPLNVVIDDGEHLFDGMTPLDMALFLRGAANQRGEDENVRALTALIDTLEEAGAQPSAEHIEARGALHAQGLDGDIGHSHFR